MRGINGSTPVAIAAMANIDNRESSLRAGTQVDTECEVGDIGLRVRGYLAERTDNPAGEPHEEFNERGLLSPIEVVPHDTGPPLAQHDPRFPKTQAHW